METDYSLEFSAAILRSSLSSLLGFRHNTATGLNDCLNVLIEHGNIHIDDPALSQVIHGGPFHGPLLHEVLWNCGHYRMSSASGLSWVHLLLDRGASVHSVHLDMGPIGVLVCALRQSLSQAANLTPIVVSLLEAGADPWNGLCKSDRIEMGVDGIVKLLVDKGQSELASYLAPLMYAQKSRDEAAVLNSATAPTPIVAHRYSL